MSLHREVEQLALLGWRLHPASRFSRASCVKHATDLATCKLDQLTRWSLEFPRCNWRVVMEGSGVWALDVDAPGPDHQADGIKALHRLVEKNGSLPPGPTTRSGGGGRGYFFKDCGEPIVGKTGTPDPGLDPRRGKLTVTIPPSVHHRTRQPYTWIIPPWEIAPPPAPAWLIKLVSPPPVSPTPAMPRRPPDVADTSLRYARAALRHAVERVAAAPNGTRNDTLNREVFAMTRFIGKNLLEAS
jgi:hypothetical protein